MDQTDATLLAATIAGLIALGGILAQWAAQSRSARLALLERRLNVLHVFLELMVTTSAMASKPRRVLDEPERLEGLEMVQGDATRVFYLAEHIFGDDAVGFLYKVLESSYLVHEMFARVLATHQLLEKVDTDQFPFAAYAALHKSLLESRGVVFDRYVGRDRDVGTMPWSRWGWLKRGRKHLRQRFPDRFPQRKAKTAREKYGTRLGDLDGPTVDILESYWEQERRGDPYA